MGVRSIAALATALFAACVNDPNATEGAAANAPSALSIPDRSNVPSTPCPVAAFANSGSDAAAVITACIAATPANGVLALPPGVYEIANRLEVAKPITLTTVGRMGSAPCGREAAHGCAELRGAPTLLSPFGILYATGGGVVIDHIVLNGNRPQRAAALAACRSGDQAAHLAGYNARIISCAQCGFVGSTSKNAVCASALEVAGNQNTDMTVVDSDFAYNGRHDDPNGWSDGLTVHDGARIVIARNRFHDNTDVDLILGGCQNCVVENNVLTHDGSYGAGSFAAIMIQAFALTTSGRYDGSVIRNNVVDCGDKQGCGMGLYVGSRAWYEASRVVNGTVVGNSVFNAQIGVVIGFDVTGTSIGDNDAGPSNGNARCNTIQEGYRNVEALQVEPGSQAVFSGSRVPRASYVTSLISVGTVPNSAPGCVARAVAAVPAATNTAPPTSACPAPHYAVVPNRHAGGAAQCVPSCGQAGVDAQRAGAHLATPNRANPLVAAEVGNMCNLNGLTYLFSYEEVTQGQVCCANL